MANVAAGPGGVAVTPGGVAVGETDGKGLEVGADVMVAVSVADGRISTVATGCKVAG